MKRTIILSFLLSFLLSCTQLILVQETGSYLESQSYKFFSQASELFYQQKFKDAADLYQKSFALEIEKPSLPQKYWYVLVDNYGMACGISGNLDKAEEIFRYGLSKDNTYPMFYYNLACVFAEREKLDECLEYLGKAIKLKDHILADESFSDPSKDDSFQRYIKEEKFIKLLKDNNYLPALTEVENDWHEYSNKEYGYSMIFPKSWSFTVPDERYHVVRCEYRKDPSRKDIEGSLKVVISSANGNGSLEDYANAATKVYELVGKDINVNKKERIVINGIECLLHDFTFSYKNKSLPNRQRTITYYYPGNGKIYNVNYMGDSDFYDKNMDLIQKSLKSFKLLQ